MANLEALWVARPASPGRDRRSRRAGALHPRPHRRACSACPSSRSRCDRRGRMDIARPRAPARARRRRHGRRHDRHDGDRARSIPLPEILALRERHGFRLHADAAYGGYFALADNLAAEARAAFDRLGEADSIVIDPHKHGLQPYGCGCVLFRDPRSAASTSTTRPTPTSPRGELHLGEISLECSRAGRAAAVALWATQRCFRSSRAASSPAGLSTAGAAALELHRALAADARFLPAFAPELDIVVWIPRAATASAASRRSRRDLRRGCAAQPPPGARRAAGGVLRPRGARGSPGDRRHGDRACGRCS